MSDLRPGDIVQFYQVLGVPEYTEHIVRSVHPNGIPSCRKPMVMLEGYRGVVLASHCVRLDMELSEQDRP